MEEHEAERVTPLVRKSRNGDDSKIVAVSAVNGEVSNGVAQNGVENEEMLTPSSEEQKMEESGGVLEYESKFLNGELKFEEEILEILLNGKEFVNGEQKIEERHGFLENESEFINGQLKIEESDSVVESEAEFINGGQKEEESDGVLEDEIEFINGELKIEESDSVLESETEFINDGQKEEESDGILEDELEFINGEKKEEESDGVLENEAEFTNGELKIESGSVLDVESEAINGELKLVENLVFHDKDDGVKSTTSAHIVEEQILKGSEPIQFKVSEINSTSAEEIEVNSISSSNLQHSDSSFEEGGTSHFEPSKEIESAEIDIINEDDLEITELDVERVIQKQDTHDLYCPNCKSCITKRVILRKRKRRIRILDEDVKRNKTGSTVGPKLATVSTQSPEDQVHQEGEGEIIDAQGPNIDEDKLDREPDIFRCLSCFSFFIPTGDGFKLFKKNWFTNIFTSNKLKTGVEQGSSSQTSEYTVRPSSDSAHQSGQPSFLRDIGSLAHSSEGVEGTTRFNIAREDGDMSLSKPSVNGKVTTIGVGGKLDVKATEAVGLEETAGINITHEVRDTSLSYPNLKPSVNGKVTIGVGGNVDVKATEAVGLEGRAGINATQEDGNKTLNFPNLRPFVKWKPAAGVGGKLDVKSTEAVDATIQQFNVFTMDQPKESKPIQEVHINRDIDLSVATFPMKTQITNVESAEDGISFPQQNGLKLLITSNKGSPKLTNIEDGTETNQTVQTRDKEAIQLSPPSASVIQASNIDGKLNITVSVPHEEQDVTATIVTKSVLENKNIDSRGNDGGGIYRTEGPQQIITETKIEVHPNEPIKTEFSSALLDAPVAKGNDAVITIDRQPPTPSHTAEGIILPITAATASQTETQVITANDRGERKIEVIKSIVYGGLAESVTSLSVISSAAGGGAATLNVLALGAANLIGGLFVISHSLWDLRCDRDEQVSNEITEKKDRYRELLGRRQNFMLHVVVAIISYLIFGLVCSVVYGFSFRESDDRQLKLVVAVAASLVCILVLAVAKAYVQRPPKPYLKIVLTFMVVGFMVSGVSYAAGELVQRLLEKLGLFKPTSPPPNLLVQDIKPGWASY